ASVRLEPGKLGLTGDFAGDGGGEAQAVLTDPWSDAPARAPSAVRLTPFGEEAPGLGRLSPRGSIGSHELTDLLAWTGIDLGFSNLDDREPDVRERRGLADWQLAGGRAPSGLLLANDIEALRAEADAARRTAGWAPVPGVRLSRRAAGPGGGPAGPVRQPGRAGRARLGARSADGRGRLGRPGEAGDRRPRGRRGPRLRPGERRLRADRHPRRAKAGLRLAEPAG